MADETALFGVGRLVTLDGKVLCARAQYHLLIETGSAESTLRPIQGRVLNPPRPAGFDTRNINTRVILCLQDGREWRCVLRSRDGDLAPIDAV